MKHPLFEEDFSKYDTILYKVDRLVALIWINNGDPDPHLITWEETSHTEVGWGWFVDRKFMWMDNPFWLHDDMLELSVGGLLWHEAVQ